MPLDPAPVIAEALDNRDRARIRTKKQSKARKAKKPRIPKLHRPKKESTKTITTRLYKTWAAIVHGYYNGHCAICGKENSKDAPLNAHHIMPRQMFSGLRFDPQNGIALCPKCHKMGKWSAHKGGIWFAEWLRNHAPEKYQHCLANAVFELDCKDRMQLYMTEEELHERYSDAIAPINWYRVVAYDKKGNKVESVIKAYNNRVAEYIFWQRWPAGQDWFEKLKGIHKTEQVYVEEDEAHSGFDAERLRKDLVGRGLMDEDGNAICRQQTPRIADAAKMAIVQSAMDKQFQPRHDATGPGVRSTPTSEVEGAV
jgi:5-methylcytosine-specific restriction endonuclease McrA